MLDVKAFFDDATNTVTYVIWDKETKAAAVIDSVLDFDEASGKTSTKSAEAVAAFCKDKGLKVHYILETHAHADHLTASQYLRDVLGGKIAINEKIKDVQEIFARVFNTPLGDVRNEGDFDLFLKDGDELPLGSLKIKVMATPGHTPACTTFVVDGAAFVGDTLFMPDSGTARVDFPKGDAKTLYNSIQKIFALPDDTVLYMCHDYGAGGKRDAAWKTTVGEEKRSNIHVGAGKTEADFIEMRTARDKTLSMPRLILPSIQVNMRAGNLPKEEDNGVSYLKLPLNQF